jgi:alkyldihydroxyacetonephosphate synthase
MNNNIAASLTSILGKDKVRTDPEILDERRHDYWALSHLNDYIEQGAGHPACVVQPQRVEDVQSIVKFANEQSIPIIPFGLGSGVCGGVLADSKSILLDMSSMNRIRKVDGHNLLATFDAGVNGMDAENAVADAGLTIGHWPQSIAVSSVGGWVATRASGQFSTAYGNIEDVVYSIEAVLPNGELITAGKAPRASSGPDLRQLLLGSEGTLAVITGVTFSLRRKAETQSYTAFLAHDMVEGIEAQRQIVQSGWLPPVMRLYDHTETKRSFAEVLSEETPENCALLLMVHEGPQRAVEVEVDAVNELATQYGLIPASPQVVEQWLGHRNQVSHWNTFFDQNLVVDTIEISSPWDRIDGIYNDVVKRLKKIPGVVNASAHSSHVYRSGINLYFSFAAANTDLKALPQAYLDCWEAVIAATADNGGGISHHHGIGRVRSKYLQKDLGDSGMAVLRNIKKTLDPNYIMNPGVLLPDA